MRRFGWSSLLKAAAVPTYVFVMVPALATAAEFLGNFGTQLSARTRLSMAGALVTLIAALLVRWSCPRVIAVTQSIGGLKDAGGIARLKNVWREELLRQIDSVGLRDAARTVRAVIRPPYSKNRQDLAEEADLDQVLTAIADAEFSDIGAVSEAARSNFEHLYKKRQAALGLLMLVGWTLSAASFAWAAASIFTSGRSPSMAWLEFRGVAYKAEGGWNLVPADEPAAQILMSGDDVRVSEAKGAVSVRQGSRALRIVVPATSPARLNPTTPSKRSCPAGRSRCLGGIEYCCDREARDYCNGLWDDC
jgi:hypothetical protein